MGTLHFDRNAVCRLVSDIQLAPSSRTLAHHWLSLWRGDTLPERSALKPAELKPLLRNLIMLDVIPGKSVTVRLAGTTFNFVLGTELAGTDWIALAPPDRRAERLRIFSDIANGAIGRGVRCVEMKSGKTRTCEEIILPFCADTSGEARLALCYVDWAAGDDFTGITSREQAVGAALAFETILLPLAKAA